MTSRQLPLFVYRQTACAGEGGIMNDAEYFAMLEEMDRETDYYTELARQEANMPTEKAERIRQTLRKNGWEEDSVDEGTEFVKSCSTIYVYEDKTIIQSDKYNLSVLNENLDTDGKSIWVTLVEGDLRIDL